MNHAIIPYTPVQSCACCAGRGWLRSTWTGGDLLSRRTVPTLAICMLCDGSGVARYSSVNT
ncbi:hypothetical protein [Novacetimonas hansenii]|uniref:hypothetical protein n=1 Tax=Novacetimonas hansenii TaxID=436 RepID=UPI00094FB490|nr:hypothetical protein [Novacetimonas hansenii]